MRCYRYWGTGLLLILIMGACADRPQSVPSAPATMEVLERSVAADVTQRINALVPPGPDRGNMHSRWAGVMSAWNSNQQALARARAADFEARLLQLYTQNSLLDPNDAARPTTLEAVLQLRNIVYTFVGQSEKVITEPSQNVDFGLGVVGPGAGQVLTNSGHAALLFPAGAFPSNTIVSIVEQPGYPFPSPLPQFPPVYDFSATNQPALPVTVSICPNDPFDPAGKAIAHETVVGVASEVLPVVPGHACDGNASDFRILDGQSLFARGVNAVGRAVASFGPRTLYGAHAAIAGSTTSLSRFVAVEPEDGQSTGFFSGELTDAVGDAAEFEGVTSPDITTASITVDDGEVTFSIQFAAGTFDPNTVHAVFSLDTDLDANTGHAGTYPSCDIDTQLIGVDYIVVFNEAGNGTAQLMVNTDGCQSFQTVASYQVSYGQLGMEVVIPVSQLDTPGPMRFKAVSMAREVTGALTGILDQVSDAGDAPGMVTSPIN